MSGEPRKTSLCGTVCASAGTSQGRAESAHPTGLARLGEPSAFPAVPTVSAAESPDLTRSLTILQVAFPFAPVGFDTAGGAEQVVALLDSALMRRGHRSIVLACEGSRTEGELVAAPRVPTRLDEAACASARFAYARQLERTARARHPDVIHMHGVDFMAYLPNPGWPVLATLHLPRSYYDASLFALSRPRTYLNCVSTAQKMTWPPAHKPPYVVANGIRLEDYAPRDWKGDFVVALGRICPEKGFHLALDAARMARCRLILAGYVFPYHAHERYFQEQITPRLDEQRRFIGPVDLTRKRVLLSAARCLLVTSTVAETSSLVAMEALASGTPVIAFRTGALADIVVDGKTGFLVSTVDQMAEAVRIAHTLDPEACRRSACEQFSAEAMVLGYLRLYMHLVSCSQERDKP